MQFQKDKNAKTLNAKKIKIETFKLFITENELSNILVHTNIKIEEMKEQLPLKDEYLCKS